MTSASSVPEAGQSKPVLWGNAEGWGGEGGGGGNMGFRWGAHVHPSLIHVVWQKPPQYCTIINL